MPEVTTEQSQLTAYGQGVLERLRVIDDYDDVNFVLRSGDFEITSPLPEFGGRYWNRLLGGTLAGLDGDQHYQRRRLESVLFRRDTLSHYEADLVRPAVLAKLESLRAQRDPDGRVRADLVRLLKLTLFRLMARLTGLDGVEDERSAERMEELFDAIDQGIRIRFTLADPEAVTRRAMEARDRLVQEFFAPSWRRRERLLETDAAGLPNDLISLILSHPAHFAEWDPELAIREVTLFIAGSVGTTVNHTCHTVEELCRWLEQNPDEEAKLTDPGFLARAFEEELRGWSVLPTMLRRARCAITLPSGLAVRAGEVVSLSVQEASHAAFGPGAGDFDPERDPPAGVKRYMLAFGHGTHTCIGKPLVLGDGRSGPGARLGTVKTILLELMSAGVRADPDRPCTFRDDNARGTHLTFPVIFTRL